MYTNYMKNETTTQIGNSKMTFLLQIQTKDLGLMLLTEVTSTTLAGLQIEAKKMVASNPKVRGMAYRVFRVVKNAQGCFDSKMVKEGVVSR